MTPSGSGQSFFVPAGGAISMSPWSVVYVVVYWLQPDEPDSLPSSPNVAVSVVPGSGLETASPFRNAVTSQSPTGDAAAKRSTSASSSSSRTSSSPSEPPPATRPSAST